MNQLSKLFSITKNNALKEHFTSIDVIKTQASDIPLVYIEYYIMFVYLIYKEINNNWSTTNTTNLTTLIANNKFDSSNLPEQQKLYDVIINLDKLANSLPAEVLNYRIDILSRLSNMSKQIFTDNNVKYLQTLADTNKLSNNFKNNIPNFINLLNTLLTLYINDASNIVNNNNNANNNTNNNTNNNAMYIIILILSICLIISLYVIIIS